MMSDSGFGPDRHAGELEGTNIAVNRAQTDPEAFGDLPARGDPIGLELDEYGGQAIDAVHKSKKVR